jgi:hypothetical protein
MRKIERKVKLRQKFASFFSAKASTRSVILERKPGSRDVPSFLQVTPEQTDLVNPGDNRI